MKIKNSVTNSYTDAYIIIRGVNNAQSYYNITIYLPVDYKQIDIGIHKLYKKVNIDKF